MSAQKTLAELADECGIPARTIRFYISRGLLDGPVKAGRGAVYTTEHLARLERIKELQSEGRMLSEIAPILGTSHPVPAIAPSAWWQHAVADDILIWTRADVSPWRLKQLRAAIAELEARLAKNESKDEPAPKARRNK
jgi:DNA-binding transcriptional MerR regulator